jgi:hypothetical protein
MWTWIVVAALSGSIQAQESSRGNESVVQAGWRQHHGGVAPLFRHRQVPCYPVSPDCPPATPMVPGSPTPVTPTDPMMPPVVPPGTAPDLSGLTTPFATATEGGGLQGRSFNEAFDGDFATVFYRKNLFSTRLERRQIGTRQEVRTIIVDGEPVQVVVTVPVFGDVPVTTAQSVLVPVPGRYSGISITDNDSPRPTDRLYFHYSYYDGIGAQMNPGLGNITMNRPMLGFEKTFLGGDASVGMRLPFIQLNGPPGVGADAVGDLSILTKYAFVNDPNGNVLSTGLIITTPTGPRGGVLVDGSEVPHSTLFQPWAGFVHIFDRAYAQGITAIIIPTDQRDTTLWANSLGVGYWLYRADGDRLVRGIIPVAEVHVRTPLNNRDESGLVFLQDQVNLTGGLHVRFPRATMGGAVCVPVVSPRPWNVEAVANFTYWF